MDRVNSLKEGWLSHPSFFWDFFDRYMGKLFPYPKGGISIRRCKF